MTGEDLEVWGAPPPQQTGEAPDGVPGDRDERGLTRDARWRGIPVRWLVIVPLVVAMGVWVNSYANLRSERDQALDALAAARGEAGRASQLLDLQQLESEFRSFDLLMLPEADGFRATLGVVNVINAEGAPRTWLLMRARGAEARGRYQLEVKPCEDGPDFPPFTARNTPARDGQLEITAQNLDVPTDQDDVVVIVRTPDGEPLVGVLGPLVLPRRMVTGPAAANLC